VTEFLDALEKEIALVGHNREELDTVYAGGGTPSRLGADGIARMLHTVGEKFRIAAGAEITMEANPEDVSLLSAKAWRQAGVNRISLGVQSFDDSVLRWMHRVHDAAQSTRAVSELREAGFDNISIDLIFAVPASLNRSWERDLETAIAHGPDHVSLYGLTIEDHTPLARWESRGDFTSATDDRYAAEFLAAHNDMTAAGHEHYEVSNFCKPGHRSRHNSAYWSGSSYLGIGPGAHSFDGASRWWNARDYVDWLNKASSGDGVIVEKEMLDDSQRATERVYLGLRTSRGLAATHRERKFISQWIDAGWATTEDGIIRLTAEGWLRLDALASQLTAA
jgi:oxygen-independent coproporphyrinogen-3 oxidase